MDTYNIPIEGKILEALQPPTNWNRCPSVSYGGKAYFYVKFEESGKTTVMWDRQSGTWGISKNDSLIETGYKTADKAMAHC